MDVLEDKKAENIVLLDLRPDTVIADFFVVATGTSERQIRALSNFVRDELKDEHSERPFSVEGTPESGWVLLDYGEVVVHLMNSDRRDYYDLEGLWSNVAQVLLSIQ